ncbi:MAG: hypothetical protein ACTSO9_11100, partial [Candidatus Helarchaeota archaeon]
MGEDIDFEEIYMVEKKTRLKSIYITLQEMSFFNPSILGSHEKIDQIHTPTVIMALELESLNDDQLTFSVSELKKLRSEIDNFYSMTYYNRKPKTRLQIEDLESFF